MFYQIKNNYIVLSITAKPNAKKSEIVGIFNDTLKIALKAPATEGKANHELIKFLSSYFKIPKTEIQLLTGQTGRIKRVQIPLNDETIRKTEELIHKI